MYVDIHNHILPGIDDGSPNVEYALDMARLAVLDGTDTMVATPHRVWMLRRDAPADWVQQRVDDLQQAIDVANIPLKVVSGVEIPVGSRVASDLKEGKLSALGGRKNGWALIELPFETMPTDAFENISRVIETGFHVVLAHPERNAVIQGDLSIMYRFAQIGLSFQLTTGSIIGRMGARAQAASASILRMAAEWKIVVASDSHNLDHRPPNLMTAARSAVSEIVGAELAMEMFDSRPRSMVEY